MNAPAPPVLGVPGATPPDDCSTGVAPEVSESALALRAVQIGKVNLDDIWLAASSEVSRAEVTARIHLAELRAAAPGSVKARMHARIAAEHYALRDCFFSMCRLVERIKGSTIIKEEIHSLADSEKSDQAALRADYLREIAANPNEEHG